MPWSSSPLRSSLKSVKTFAGTKSRKVASSTESAPISDYPDREKWLQEIKRSRDVLDHLVTGYPLIGTSHLQPLKQSTADYLKWWGISSVQPSLERDEILGDLIDKHTTVEHLTRDVATLACLHAFSTSAATSRLLSLMDLDVERYLRCIALAGKANLCIAGKELNFAQSLLRLLSGQGQDFREFQYIIEVIGSGEFMGFIPLYITQNALARCSIRSRLQAELDSQLEQRHFMSAFLAISWLQNLPVALSNDIITVLDRHLPSWFWLKAWRPNKDRIGQWEHGNFTEAQRKKLLHVFDLDGPDTATHSKQSLKMATPECSARIAPHPPSPQTLERSLDLLYRAQLFGPGAVELFIHLCVENSADEADLTMIEKSIDMEDESFCSKLLVMLRSFGPRPSLVSQIRGLTQALPIFVNNTIPGDFHLSTQQLADRLNTVVEAAQAEFCAQLEKGTGEYMGMLIYDLGKAILQAPWIHSNLSQELLAAIRQYPPQDSLEAIFEQLQDHSGSSSSEFSRFKSYLASSLGGRAGAGMTSETLAAMREELQFWKHPPDTFRKDLARTFVRIRSMDYCLYTSCLLAMLKENDLFISEMRYMIRPENEQTCINFTDYLARRRGLGQLQNNCWLLLLESLVREQVASFLPRTADSLTFDQWLKFVDGITHLLAPVRSRLPLSGPGLTQERLSWWDTLSHNMTTVRSLLAKQGERGDLKWLYFPLFQTHIMGLLETLDQGKSMLAIHGLILSHLAPDGRNVVIVCDCIRTTTDNSTVGRAVCERVLLRKGFAEGERWSELGLAVVFEMWLQSPSLTQADKLALDHIRKLLQIPGQPQESVFGPRSASERLQHEHDTLLSRARKLESLRLRLRLRRPEQTAALLQRLGVDNPKSCRVADKQIPVGLVDAVEPVGDAEYELSFALTGLGDLRRRARGLPKDCRLLVIRLCLRSSPQFCIHFSPGDEGQSQHKYWRPTDNSEPSSAICTTRPNLFTYHLGRRLHQWLRKGKISLESVYSAVLQLITTSPTTCLVCSCPMRMKRWKPAPCSRQCSLKLRDAPLEVQLHNLLVETSSIDLLLTCIYAAAASATTLSLLPGCPVQTNRIKAVIDSFPPLASLQTATDLQSAIRGRDSYGRDRERLLSWLCLRFRGFMLAAPAGFRVPSMPNTRQFLLLNSNHEREELFAAQPGSRPGHSGAVFHGTQVSRLFLIITEGLKGMSNTPFMLHGAASGNGVYCGNDQATSLGFAGNTGQSWKNSELSNMRIMLGCELAAYTAPSRGTVHMVAAEKRLLVRYVFLLPQNYQPPPRRHVEPAMNAAFANLRTGLLA